MFIGREKELAYLNELHASNHFELAIIYGRRRVGKTTLLVEFSKENNCIYYMADEENEYLQTKQFETEVFKVLPRPSYLNGFDNITEVIEYIASCQIEENLTIIIDEFPYIAMQNKSILSRLQKVIDQQLKNSKIKLILCGSSISFMENKLLSYKSPLFGRRTAQLEIEPFSFEECRQFASSYDIFDQIRMYSITGGVAQYLEVWDESVSVEDNISRLFLRSTSFLLDEPLNILRQEVRNPAIYQSILHAISSGSSKLNEISTKINEKPDKTLTYLKTLMTIRIVEKVKPVLEKESKRKTLYRINDPMISFVYRFVHPYRLLIHQNESDYIYREHIQPMFEHYVSSWFEVISREHLISYIRQELEESPIEEIGNWWGTNKALRQQEEIDILGISKDFIYVGECKWRNEKVGMKVIETLRERADLLPSQLPRKFLVYSKSGFKDSVLECEDVLLIDVKNL